MQNAPMQVWVEGKTIGEVLRATAERFGERNAVVFPGCAWRATWREFDEQVNTVARALYALGLRKGDHLAVWASNCPEWVLLQFATARIGIVLVTVNPAYRGRELEYTLKQSDAKALALSRCYKKNDFPQIFNEVCPEWCKQQDQLSDRSDSNERGPISQAFPRLQHVIALCETDEPGLLPWSALLQRAEEVSIEQIRAEEQRLSPEDVVNIQYTSGTTGFPKGAMLTHRNLLLNAFYTGQGQRLTAEDRMCIPVPLYHCFGCVLGTLVSAVYGAAMIFPHEFFDGTRTLSAIERERCTVLYGVPTMFLAQLEDQTFVQRDLTSLRTGLMSGAPCPVALMRRVIDVMGCRDINIVYGQTEASPLITQTDCDDPIDIRCGTVGHALPGIEVKIADVGTGTTLPQGEPGELCARGHNVMRGYYNMPEQTARAIDSDGWLHTGDVAVELPNGYYRITGRLKDMIIRGGENIYPREIEEFLYTHPAVEEVQVVGVPDVKYGEQILAWIKLRVGHSVCEEEIREFCRHSLARFKAPRYVKFVDVFPMTVTGKIQKYKIRELAIQELGLEDASKIETA